MRFGGAGRCRWRYGGAVRRCTGRNLLIASFWLAVISSGASVIAIDTRNGHRGIWKKTNRGAVRTE